VLISTQFTCFAGTKVQKLTLQLLAQALLAMLLAANSASLLALLVQRYKS
jgi:hypothetical protein